MDLEVTSDVDWFGENLPMKKIFSLHFKIPLLLILTLATSISAIWFESIYLFNHPIAENLDNSQFLLTAGLTAIFITLVFGWTFSILLTLLVGKLSRSSRKIIEGEFELEIKKPTT